MKGIVLLPLLLGMSSSYAGVMGPISEQPVAGFSPYIGLEGSYTWNQIGSTQLNTFSTSSSDGPWGGRLSIGATHPFSERFSFSAELGGGYYGSTDQVYPSHLATLDQTIDGYDLLGGAIYQFNQVSVFGQLGVMMQNTRVKASVNNTIVPGGIASGVQTNIFNYTQALPEIRVGGMYSLSNNWGLSLAYMHVFGSVRESSYVISLTPSSSVQQGQSILQNPTLDSVMLGVRYMFSNT